MDDSNSNRLEEIEARLGALPSEPEWKPEWNWRGYGEGVYDAWTQIRTFYQDNAHDHNEAFKIVADSAQADAAFIAKAPADIRYLVSEVKRLRGELVTAKIEYMDGLTTTLERAQAHLKRQDGQIARLEEIRSMLES